MSFGDRDLIVIRKNEQYTILSRWLSGGSPGSVSGLEPHALDLMQANLETLTSGTMRGNFHEPRKRSIDCHRCSIITPRNFRRSRLGWPHTSGDLFTFPIFTRRNRRSTRSPIKLNYLRALEFGSIVRKNRLFCTVHEQFTILHEIAHRTWIEEADNAEHFTARACKTKSNKTLPAIFHTDVNIDYPVILRRITYLPHQEESCKLLDQYILL